MFSMSFIYILRLIQSPSMGQVDFKTISASYK